MNTTFLKITVALLLGMIFQNATAETRAEKVARCEEVRLQCIEENQHRVVTNQFGVRIMPVEVVKECGKRKLACIQGN